MKRLAKTILKLFLAAIILVAVFSFITSQYTSEHEGLTFPSKDLNKEEKELHGSYLVSYVIDGDTFLTVIDGEEIKVRLIGVDTPESVNEVNPEKNCKEGNIASDYTKKLLAGETVYLEYDINKTDDYGRTLAYVYLDESGSDMVQERLLKDGMANVISVGSNIKYLFKFRFLAAQARAKKSGFWAENFWGEG